MDGGGTLAMLVGRQGQLSSVLNYGNNRDGSRFDILSKMGADEE